MRLLFCVLLIVGCSADCRTLAARYAAAFQDAQKCIPGQDTCTFDAPVAEAVDGGSDFYVNELCVNGCGGGGNVNPKRTAQLVDALNAYNSECPQPRAGCLCAQAPDGGWPPYTCRPADGGGVCSP